MAPEPDAATARLASAVVYAARSMGGPVLRGLAAIPAVRRLIELALDEDLGRGDVTSRAGFGGDAARPDGPRVVADMVAREPIVAFGIDVAVAVFALVEPAVEIERGCADGSRVERGALLASVR